MDSRTNVIKVKKSWSVPYLAIKLYGGQQFERLLSEFKVVVEHTPEIEASEDDIANAAGRMASNLNNYAWTASDIARQHSQQARSSALRLLLFLFSKKGEATDLSKCAGIS